MTHYNSDSIVKESLLKAIEEQTRLSKIIDAQAAVKRLINPTALFNDPVSILERQIRYNPYLFIASPRRSP